MTKIIPYVTGISFSADEKKKKKSDFTRKKNLRKNVSLVFLIKEIILQT